MGSEMCIRDRLIGCFQDLEVCKNMFSERREEEQDVDLRLIFYDISQQAPSIVRSTAVCSTVFRRDLLLQLFTFYHIFSAVTALQAATQLEVACLLFFVLRDEQLAIHRPVHFTSPAAAGIVCYTAVKLLATTS